MSESVDDRPVVDASEIPARAVSPWAIFAIVGTANAMLGIDITIVSTGLATLHRALHAPIVWAGWTITVFQLGLLVGLPVMGSISDQFGRRRVFLYSLLLFTVSSLACGLANSIYLLVGFRALQAIGCAAFFPSATGLVYDHFGERRQQAIGILTSIFPIGATIGPIVGSFVISGWSWRGIFFINVPIGVVLLALAPRILPKTEGKSVAGPDFVGLGMLAVSLLAVMYGIAGLGNGKETITSPIVLWPLLIGVVLLVLFYRHLRGSPSPFIPLKLITTRAFATMNFINFIYGACVLGFGSLVPYYAAERFKLPLIEQGTVLSARAVGALLITWCSSMLIMRTGYRKPIVGGAVLVTIALLLTGASPRVFGPYGWLMLAGAIFGIGMGIAAPASNNALLHLAPESVSSIAGMRGMCRQAGGIFAISVTTAIVGRSANPAIALGHAFVIFALVLIVVIPIAFTVPMEPPALAAKGSG